MISFAHVPFMSAEFECLDAVHITSVASVSGRVNLVLDRSVRTSGVFVVCNFVSARSLRAVVIRLSRVCAVVASIPHSISFVGIQDHLGFAFHLFDVPRGITSVPSLSVLFAPEC